MHSVLSVQYSSLFQPAKNRKISGEKANEWFKKRITKIKDVSRHTYSKTEIEFDERIKDAIGWQ